MINIEKILEELLKRTPEELTEFEKLVINSKPYLIYMYREKYGNAVFGDKHK